MPWLAQTTSEAMPITQWAVLGLLAALVVFLLIFSRKRGNC